MVIKLWRPALVHVVLSLATLAAAWLLADAFAAPNLASPSEQLGRIFC
jgi:hypothetical protein